MANTAHAYIDVEIAPIYEIKSGPENRTCESWVSLESMHKEFGVWDGTKESRFVNERNVE